MRTASGCGIAANAWRQTSAINAARSSGISGGPPAIGFLLGTRAYRSELGEFPLGATLSISVEPLVADPKLGAFQCAIALDRIVATAVVNTYQPAADELVLLRRGAGAA